MRPSAFSARAGLERIGVPVIIGLLVLPLLIGGILIWALWSPTANLDRVTAAVVNDDVPVTVNGSTVPLGRQFAAGLIAGGATTTDSAGSGGASTATPAPAPAPAPTPDASNFDWILTNDADAKAGLLTGRYAAVVTIPRSFSADATSLSGPAADARQASLRIETSPVSALVDPALSAAVTSAATASLNRQLTAQYLSNVYAGFNSINQQIGQAATGASSVSSGASSVSQGAQSLAGGAASLSSGLTSLDSGAGALAGGLGTLDTQSQSLPDQTAQLAAGADGVAAAVNGLSSSISSATASFATIVAQVCRIPGPGTVCADAQAALAKLQAANQSAAQLAGGAGQVAAGNQQLAAAMPPLVAGIDESAAGAVQVATGATQADDGAASLSSGAASLAGGAAQVDTGAAQLSDGLGQAVTQIPTYTDADISTLSTVASQPVLADQKAPSPGFQSVPLFAAIALWFGGLAAALSRKAVPSRPLLTTASSSVITLRSARTGALVGLAQGLLIASVAQFALGLGLGEWAAFSAVAMVAGAVFAVVNQGLAASFGSVGRLVALVLGVVALAAGLSSTVPAAVVAVAGASPTAAALSGLRASAVGDAATAWGAVALLVVFGLAGLVLVFTGVAARRGARALEPASRRTVSV